MEAVIRSVRQNVVSRLRSGLKFAAQALYANGKSQQIPVIGRAARNDGKRR
jgi:hypothetical protein